MPEPFTCKQGLDTSIRNIMPLALADSKGLSWLPLCSKKAKTLTRRRTKRRTTESQAGEQSLLFAGHSF
jgi:hypothetical protein